jgi:hypothetical protein
MPSALKLNINKNTCGNWKSHYILDILEKYPQTNFQEWNLLEIHHKNKPNEIAVNMVCKFWFPYSDPWNRKMCDWTINNQLYTAKDGNQVKHGNNHSVQLPSTKIWNTTVAGRLVRLHGPIKSYFVVRQNSIVA